MEGEWLRRSGLGDLQSAMTMAWELRVWRHCAGDVMLVGMIGYVGGLLLISLAM